VEQLLLNEYLDRSLEPGQQEIIEQHLQDCEECRTHLSELRQLFAAIEALPESPLERDLSAAVLSKIRSEPAKRVSAWPKLAFILQGVAAAAILAVSWPVIDGGLPEFTFHPSPGAFTTLLVEIFQFWPIETGQILQIVQRAGLQNLDWIRQLFSLNQPALLVWTACLGITFILWLVGNSFLLKSQRPNLNRRKS
jgi:Predicted transmembrane transcriptional regulator (anti-sigma factor)